MDLKALIKSSPKLLTILPTHKCTASCESCCFGCSPRINHKMSFDDMKYHVDQAVETFPTLRVMVISGGECFLLGKDLDRIIAYSSQKGLITRVVTNAFWATTYDIAYSRLLQLKQAGLCELNLSTGKNHQQYVNPNNIVNAATSGARVGFKPIQIAFEKHPDLTKEHEAWQHDEQLSELIADKTVNIVSGPWMNFRKETENLNLSFGDTFIDGADDRCKSLYHYLTINPYSQLLACCGLTAEYNPYLKLGSLLCQPLDKLYSSQFEDLYILWLYTHGPKYIYDLLMDKRGLVSKKLYHICAYCIEIIQDEANIALLKKIISENIPSIFYELELINKNLKS